MSNSKISVLLLGEQLPAMRRVAIQNAISVLDLKTDTAYKADPDHATRPVPTYVNKSTTNPTKPVTYNNYNSSNKNSNSATVKTGQKTQAVATKSTNKPKLDLDDIVFKAVGNAIANQ